MRQNITELDVFYNKRYVGTLKNSNNKILFQYSKQWIENGFSISPFSLPLSNTIYSSDKDYFEGVFGVFYDSLPDGWGRLLVNRYFAKQGINYESLPILDKLSITTSLSKGALEYKPHSILPKVTKDISLDDLATSFCKIYDEESCADLDEAYSLAGTSGGARIKAYLTLNNTRYIVKFPSKNDSINVGKEEYLANELARKCGIKTNNYTLLPSKKCNGYFAAERFDRVKDSKVHMISFSSLLETTFRIPNLDYELLFQVTRRISHYTEDLYEVFRRMCFNILYKNKDDHGNNFAFIYDENSASYRISPFFDITCTPNKLEHEMTLLSNPNPSLEDIVNCIDVLSLNKNKCMEIINTVKTVLNIK